VARVFKPGCEVHTVLILVGRQGYRKSRWFKTLAGADWFSDAKIDIENKDALMLLQKVWILEWGELAAMQKARDLESLKAFITSSDNDFRQPYGRRMVRAKRHCVIVGTTNKREILVRPHRQPPLLAAPGAGPHRPGAHGRVARPALGEAVAAFRAGEQWHLTDEEEELLAEAQVQFQERDPWEEKVLHWLEFENIGPKEVAITTSNILEHALRKAPATWNRADQNKVGRILRTAGYVKDENRSRDEDGHKLSRTWRKLPRSAPANPIQNSEDGA
jgi:predicted P-loop ATPase